MHALSEPFIKHDLKNNFKQYNDTFNIQQNNYTQVTLKRYLVVPAENRFHSATRLEFSITYCAYRALTFIGYC